MKEDVTFSKTVYSKREYEKIVDISFSNPNTPDSISQALTEEPDINQFFDLYTDLFFNIPQFGEVNSHEYLIKQSSEYINFNPNQEELTSLQEEIAQLRTELLEEQRKNLELQTGESINFQNIGEGENTVGGVNVINTNNI